MYREILLVWEQIEFPKTHNIELLVSLIPGNLRPLFVIEDPDRMSEFAVTTRYPGMYQIITPMEARKAVATARRVRREVRKLLPRRAKVLREM